MKNRSPIKVFVFGLITLGIYSWYWSVKTKGEMNRMGEHIPTAWIWLIPIVGSIWWYWKYAEAVEHVTNDKVSAILAFLVEYLLGGIGDAILQDSFNKLNPPLATAGVPTAQPIAGPIHEQPVAAPVIAAPVVETSAQPTTITPQSYEPPTHTPPAEVPAPPTEIPTPPSSPTPPPIVS
jgi:hypothetical protein